MQLWEEGLCGKASEGLHEVSRGNRLKLCLRRHLSTEDTWDLQLPVGHEYRPRDTAVSLHLPSAAQTRHLRARGLLITRDNPGPARARAMRYDFPRGAAFLQRPEGTPRTRLQTHVFPSVRHTVRRFGVSLQNTTVNTDPIALKRFLRILFVKMPARLGSAYGDVRLLSLANRPSPQDPQARRLSSGPPRPPALLSGGFPSLLGPPAPADGELSGPPDGRNRE